MKNLIGNRMMIELGETTLQMLAEKYFHSFIQ